MCLLWKTCGVPGDSRALAGGAGGAELCAAGSPRLRSPPWPSKNRLRSKSSVSCVELLVKLAHAVPLRGVQTGLSLPSAPAVGSWESRDGHRSSPVARATRELCLPPTSGGPSSRCPDPGIH